MLPAAKKKKKASYKETTLFSCNFISPKTQLNKESQYMNQSSHRCISHLLLIRPKNTRVYEWDIPSLSADAFWKIYSENILLEMQSDFYGEPPKSVCAHPGNLFVFIY